MKSEKKIRTRSVIKILKKLYPRPKIALIFSNPWELYVSVVLSAQTTDKKVNEVTEKLFKKYTKISDYEKTSVSNLEKEIKSIGLYRNKAKYIKNAAKIINEKYNGKIPSSMSDLLKIPGVGRKTANILLGSIYKKSEGIAVDTHVARLSRVLGLTKQKDPNKIERDLIKIIPKKDWIYFNHAMVLYGRQYCPARCKHKECPLREFIV